MTKAEAIQKYGLKQKGDGDLPQGIEVYTAEKETDKARYVYTLDNMATYDSNLYALVIERYSKTATVWSDLFGAYIPRKTFRTQMVEA